MDGSDLAIRLVGTGDAFGSGGRLNTCFHVASPDTTVLIDCGASSLIGLKRCDLEPGRVDTVLVTHFHGDHYGGLPFLIRETQIAQGRSRPLRIVGPAGLRDRLHTAMESLFPGSSGSAAFPLEILELPSRVPYDLGNLHVLLMPVVHTPGTNAHGVRLEIGGRVVGYSGDTEWTPHLPQLAEGADLFLCECYTWDATPNHMDYRTLLTHQHELACERLVITHMGSELLARAAELDVLPGEDGMMIPLPLRR